MTGNTPRFSWTRPDRLERGWSPLIIAPSGHLRAPIRLALFAAAFVVAWVLGNAFLYPVLAAATSGFANPLPLFTWLMLFAAAVACVIALRLIDEQPWRVIGCGREAWRAKPLAVGTFAGSSTIVVVLLGLLAIGGAEVLAGDAVSVRGSGSKQWLEGAARALWLLAPAALWEELVFRGYLWRVVEDASNRMTALWASSIAFGVIHLSNPGVNARSIVAVVSAGFALGLIRDSTGSLPAAWLAHLLWNWIMAAVAHAPVSGLPAEPSTWQFVPHGPDWLSGGAWGPEGSAVALAVLWGTMFTYRAVRRARVRGIANDSSTLSLSVHATTGS